MELEFFLDGEVVPKNIPIYSLLQKMKKKAKAENRMDSYYDKEMIISFKLKKKDQFESLYKNKKQN